jgi:hypothetical protein
MGIITDTLINYKLESDKEIVIERNENGSIHIHYGHTRLNLSEENFELLCMNIVESAKKLRDIKDL